MSPAVIVLHKKKTPAGVEALAWVRKNFVFKIKDDGLVVQKRF